jgi:hypothetical protein
MNGLNYNLTAAARAQIMDGFMESHPGKTPKAGAPGRA